MRKHLMITAVAVSLLTVPAFAEQLPKPMSTAERSHETRCGNMARGLQNAMLDALDFAYEQKGITDRDQLIKVTTRSLGVPAMWSSFVALGCNMINGKPGPADLPEVMARLMIEDRFGPAKE